MKAAALRGALSDRARNDRVHVVTGLLDGDAPRPSRPCGILNGLSQRKHVLVVRQRSDELTWQSLRNAPTVHMLVPDQLNTYDVLVSDDVVFTHEALLEFLAGPSKGRAVTGRVPPRAKQRREGRREMSSIHKDHRDVLLVPGHLGEELWPARREQVHVPRAPGRQQDADQDRRREGLRRQGHRVNTINRAGQAQAHPHRVRQAQGTPSAPSSRVAEGDRIDIFGGPVCLTGAGHDD